MKIPFLSFLKKDKAGEPVNDKKMQKALTLFSQLQMQSLHMAKTDHRNWRLAHQAAINPDCPRRAPLLDIYYHTTALDTHLLGVVNRTKYGILQQRIMLSDRNGEEDLRFMGVADSKWFYDLCNHILDAEYYGHSLIELSPMEDRGGMPFCREVRLIDRRHVFPELGKVVINISDEPKRGISFRNSEYAPNLIEAEGEKKLGLFLEVTPHVISKKHVQIFWDDFAEKFGMPIIMATSDLRNSEERRALEMGIQNIAHQGWIHAYAGVDFKFLQAAGGDAFNVYDRRIELANKEISIALAGQTMVFDDGSSLSQAEVHLQGFEEVKRALGKRLLFTLNDQLLPRIAAAGFEVKDLSFEFDNSQTFSSEQRLMIEQTLLNHYEIDPDYFKKKYDIPILGPKFGYLPPENEVENGELARDGGAKGGKEKEKDMRFFV